MTNEIKIAYSEDFLYHLPANHPFPITKYPLIKEQLIQRGHITSDQLMAPDFWAADVEDIHDKAYYNRVTNLALAPQEIRRIGLPLSQMAVNRARTSVSGTIMAARGALKTGLGINIGGGTHHAFRDRGEGFCVFNDIGVAAGILLREKPAFRILVVDLDVHQGNGTAAIFSNENRVFTFSMHGEKNYPFRKVPSDLDIPVPSFSGDDYFIDLLKENLPKVIDHFAPDLIFYQSGVDVLATDKLGHLQLSKQGCKDRDEVVFEQCLNREIPVVITLGGGYSPRIADVVDAHCNTIGLGLELIH